MYNLETCLSPKSSWRSFLVVFALFLLLSSCTTTERDQKGDQLAKRMTGGKKVEHIDLFYARVYTFRQTVRKDGTRWGMQVLSRCAGTFIFVDLVLTASQCLLFKKPKSNRIFEDKTIVHLDDFNQPRKNHHGVITNFTVGVLHFHKYPKNSRFFKIGPGYDIVLLQTELFSYYSFWPLRFLPIPPCRNRDIAKPAYQLKMLGMKKTVKRRQPFYLIEDPISSQVPDQIQFDTEIVQEAPFENVDVLQLFKRVYKSKKIFNIWEVKRRPKPQPLPPHRIAVFNKEGGEIGDNDEIGSPAFLYHTERKVPFCLYGVLSGFISGEKSDTFPDPSGALKNAQNVTAVELEGVFFYYTWLIKQIDEGWKRWNKTDPQMVKRAREGFW